MARLTPRRKGEEEQGVTERVTVTETERNEGRTGKRGRLRIPVER